MHRVTNTSVLELYKNLQHHESDCFKKVTIMLSEGCGSLANLDSIMSMTYAILLTLCELSTAAIPIPQECRAIQNLYTTNANVSNDVTTNCALTLSKAPQTWTSYSVMMCFAIRYPMEKEMLERLHENITLNQAKNYEILKNQHEYLAQWHQQEMHTFDHLKKSQHELWYQMQAIQQTHLQTANQVQMIFNTLKLLQNSTELAVNKYNSLFQIHAQELQSQLNEITMRHAMDIDQLLDRVFGDFSLVEKGLSRMMTAQRKVVQDWEETKMVQQEYLDVWRDSIEQVNSRLMEDQISWLLFPFKWLHGSITHLYIEIRHYALEFLVHALVFNYVLNAKTGGLIRKLGSASLATLAHFYLYRILMDYFEDEPYVDCAVLVLEYVIANGELARCLTWSRNNLFWDDASVVENAPAPPPNVSEQPRSPSPAVVPQTSNVGRSATATTPTRQYHFHNYYIKESFPELVEITDDETEDEQDEEGNTILPMSVEEYRHPSHPFQR
ncbi:hypothetical protein MUCCIDRAFT_76731 [Mucor lusitanicus CBS 277.49]|uniref:Uncharacterized protein n=1 Tax=Mucor lusitanicus CBS 277.49 TaxID=747725 RepID=A0A162RS71_MUCCL|nr:hypothetical protein MUCCIDRAFT_76731 [Mucor lusitanicus CBS 277.49]